MSIISFHRVLISTAILFCAIFAVWELRIFTVNGGIGPLLLGLFFVLLGAGCTYYLVNLQRFLKGDPRG